MKKFLKIISIICCLCVLVSTFSLSLNIMAKESSNNSIGEEALTKYSAYINSVSDYSYAGETIEILPRNIVNSSLAVFKTVEGEKNIPVMEEGGFITYEFEAEVSGKYSMYLNYCAVEGNGLDMNLGFKVDGKTLFSEAEKVSFSRDWVPQKSENGRFELDNRGNELIPDIKEKFGFKTEGFYNSDSYTYDLIEIYLSAGKHTITLSSVREPIAVKGMILSFPKEFPDYSKVSEQYYLSGKAEDFSYTIEAELPIQKSQTSINPISDKSSPAISPTDPAKIRLNTIGGSNWKYNGQWLKWEFSVPEDGYYSLSFIYKQDTLRGLYSTRKIYIDDEILFNEMNLMEFPYGNDWENIVFADKNDNPYKIFIKKGVHTIKLEVCEGRISGALQTAADAIYELNKLYRQIVMITGVTPDKYRDYYLDKEIPNLVDDFKKISETLNSRAKMIEDVTGTEGGEASYFYQVTDQLKDFIKDTQSIATRLDSFKSNISSLAQVVLTMCEQPLQLDTITVWSAESDIDDTSKASFISKFIFRFKVFLASFVEDYSNIGSTYKGSNSKEPLDVWMSINDMAVSGISTGRDHAEILKRQIDDSFTPESDVPVNVSLVSATDTLVQAILAGTGPDCALFVPKATVINLEMRNALVDLCKLEGFNKVTDRFYDSALVSFKYKNGVYALPETQAFNMLFYRKDIFGEMGLEPPESWEEFYDVVKRLQKNNMSVGIPENQSIYEMLLLQNGGRVYNDDLSKMAIMSTEGVAAFKAWTNLYIQYGLPVEFDFFNRFRTGEMPMGITTSTFYNQIDAAAPELKNLWAMVPVPGTVTDKGINRAETCNTTGAVIIRDKKANDYNNAFLFLDWWTSSQTQQRFGNELENIMGPAARYNTANKEAVKGLAWTKSEYEGLLKQWEFVSDIEPTPASYYITRCLSNAFRGAVYHNENPRETLNRYVEDMNTELTRKRKEFNLEG